MIIILGIAGSGKTTQAELLAKRLDCPAISMGELLREQGDSLIQSLMIKGDIVPDEEALPILDRALKQAKVADQEVVVEGFPRAVDEAAWLVQKLKVDRIKFTALLHLIVSEDSAVKRLLARGRPDDQSAQAIKHRFQEYNDTIDEIINCFDSHGLATHHLSGEGSVEEVAARVDEALSHAG